MLIGMSAITFEAATAPGPVTAFYRMVFALLAMLPIILVYRGFYKQNFYSILIAVCAGIFFAGDFWFWSSGIDISGPTIPTLMTNTAPVWVAIGAMLFFRERLTRLYWLGLLISITGSFIVLRSEILEAETIFWGSSLGLISAICYASYQLLAQKSRVVMSALCFLTYSTFGGLVTLGLANVLVGNRFSGFDEFTWVMFLVQGVIIQAGGWYILNYVQGIVSATILSVVLLGQPVVTAIASYFIFNENFTVWHILGGIALLIGLSLVLTSKEKGRPDKIKS